MKFPFDLPMVIQGATGKVQKFELRKCAEKVFAS
jgi:hypothetical protein